ncbi:MAG: family 78 glycoside hydrolase catalytic domain [Bacteroidota bacterium]
MLALILIRLSGFTFTIDDLKCEYLENPLGIDTKSPRFTWKMVDSESGTLQSAYQIIVGKDSSEVAKGEGISWNSGKIDSRDQLVSYAGVDLDPFTKYYWGVRVWDQNATTEVSNVSSFETGMMDPFNWEGAWISDSRDINIKPAPYFRKEFKSSKKIKTARAYIAAAGLYELYLNGDKLGNRILDPMYTRFDRRILYVTYDVTNKLTSGDNAIGAILGNGWYNHQSTAVWFFDEAPWRGRPAFCLDLRIEYEDGDIEIIRTGEDWKTSLGPIIQNSIYTGEHYDARLEMPGWNTPGFDDSSWKGVIFRSAPTQNIVAQLLHPIREVEKIEPVSMNKINDTTYVFDLGRNISGTSEISVKGSKGTIIRVKHGETLYENGHVDLREIERHYRPTDNSDPFQTDVYYLKGEGVETFKPRFNYKGFQYVEVISNKPISLTKNDLVGYFAHSDVPPVGSIKSSNPTIDKIWAATNSSYLANLFGYPTDCPQREKNGWTGDAHIAMETGLYNFDGITIYDKWMNDHKDEQQPNGVLPAIIPTGGWGYQWANGPDWTSTIAIIPWNIYLFYGDQTLLASCYDNIKNYVDYLTSISPTGICYWGLGDWVPVKSKSLKELTSTAYYYTDVVILAKTAALLGKHDDQMKYEELSKYIKTAFNESFLDRSTPMYASGYQTELSVPLFWGLVPEELKKKVAANLAQRVEKDGFHLDVGLLGSKAILGALSQNGYADVAYKIASQETYPSWGWWMVNGATTLLENWDINAETDISRNHIMFGEVGSWFYETLGGITPDERKPGFKNVIMKPYFPEELDQFEAKYESIKGGIISSWIKKKNRIEYQVTVPSNSTAELFLKLGARSLDKSLKGEVEGGQIVFQLLGGTYQFIISTR